MKTIIKNALILMAITLVSGLCLGFVYDITKEPIAQQEIQAKEDAYKAVFPDMNKLAALDPELSDEASLEQVQEQAAKILTEQGYEAARIEEAYQVLDSGDQFLGVVMNITSTEGYGGDINFSIGITADGVINGVEILTINETAGLGMKAADEAFKGQYAGKTAEQLEVTKTGAAADNQIDAISGATITSDAVTNGVNAGVVYFQYLKEQGGIFSE